MITYDETKRLQNIAKHGLDFADLTEDFFVEATLYPAKNGRFAAVGILNGAVTITVIAKPLGTQAISVISMRPASKKERKMR